MASRHLGIEVSNSAVRAAELALGGPRPELLTFAQVSLPPRSVVDGVIIDQAAVTSALRRCVEEGGFSSREAHLGIAGLRAITREIEMPRVPDSELDAAIRLQALDVIPFPADKTLLSARPLEDFTAADGTPMRRVLLAAAHRDLVDPLIEVVEGAGLRPLSIDLLSTALVRALYDPSNAPAGPEAIVSIGSALTTVVIHEAGTPHFVRTIAEGGEAITAAIAGTLDVPLNDAEVTKRNLDKPGPHIRAAAAAARDASVALLNEIRNSIDYYATLPGRSPVRRVVVTGGGSRLVGLLDRLQQQLRAPVVPGSVLSRIDCTRLALSPEDLGRRDPLAAAVIGLALPDPPGVKPLNLLPPEILEKRAQRRIELGVLVVAVVVIVALIGLGVLKFLQVHNAEDQVGTLERSVSLLQREIPRYDRAAAEHALLVRDEDTVMPLVRGEVYWPAVFDRLAADTPPGPTVTSFSGSANVPATAAQVTGSAVSPATLIGSISISLDAPAGYPYFQRWFTAIEGSGDFQIVSFSAISLSGGTTTGGTRGPVSFTSTLAVTGKIASPRIGEFLLPGTGRRS